MKNITLTILAVLVFAGIATADLGDSEAEDNRNILSSVMPTTQRTTDLAQIESIQIYHLSPVPRLHCGHNENAEACTILCNRIIVIPAIVIIFVVCMWIYPIRHIGPIGWKTFAIAIYTTIATAIGIAFYLIGFADNGIKFGIPFFLALLWAGTAVITVITKDRTEPAA